MSMKPYLVSVVLNPTKKQEDEQDEVPVLVVEGKTVLAKDDAHARAKALRLVPEEHVEKDHRLEVFVLPFCR